MLRTLVRLELLRHTARSSYVRSRSSLRPCNCRRPYRQQSKLNFSTLGQRNNKKTKRYIENIVQYIQHYTIEKREASSSSAVILK